MRELTKEEIENAPEWATDFAIIKGQVVMIGGGQITKPEGQKLLWSEVLETDFKPIPRKEFDITSYDFSDGDIQSVIVDGCEDHKYLHFTFKEETIELTQSKFDVIAMAKALKLTADDLR